VQIATITDKIIRVKKGGRLNIEIALNESKQQGDVVRMKE
jgi:hypothetical protein